MFLGRYVNVGGVGWCDVGLGGFIDCSGWVIWVEVFYGGL